MLLITGANGQTGRAILGKLASRGITPACMTSNEGSGEALRSLGGKPVVADFRDSASLVHAFRGVSRVYHIPPRMQPDETEIGLNVIRAAIEAGVAHLVVHSVITPHLEEIVFHWAKMKVEAALFAHGQKLAYTILQPTNYMQNAEWFWPMLADEGRLAFPYSADVRLSWVDIEDVAEAAANILTEPEHELATYELAGRDACLNRHEMAAIWSIALGREVRAETMTLDDYMALPRWHGRKPEDMARLRTMFRHYDHGGLPAGNHRTLSMLLRRPATTFAEYAERTARLRTGRAARADARA